jgi:hypothetical protein
MDIENIILESYVKNYGLTPSSQRPILPFLFSRFLSSCFLSSRFLSSLL